MGGTSATVPTSVRGLLTRCLDRDPHRRLRDIGEARIVLENPVAGEMQTDLAAGSALAFVGPRPLWRRAIPFTLVAIAAAAMAAIATWYLHAATRTGVTRFRFTLADEQSFTGSARNMIAMSPDGAQVVYVANGRLNLLSLSELDAKAIQGTDGYQAVNQPVFSPDGRSIAFHAVADQTLKRIGVTGGTAVTICAAPDMPLGMSWGPDGIVFGEVSKGHFHGRDPKRASQRAPLRRRSQPKTRRRVSRPCGPELVRAPCIRAYRGESRWRSDLTRQAARPRNREFSASRSGWTNRLLGLMSR